MQTTVASTITPTPQPSIIPKPTAPEKPKKPSVPKAFAPSLSPTVTLTTTQTQNSNQANEPATMNQQTNPSTTTTNTQSNSEMASPSPSSPIASTTPGANTNTGGAAIINSFSHVSPSPLTNQTFGTVISPVGATTNVVSNVTVTNSTPKPVSGASAESKNCLTSQIDPITGNCP